MQEVHLPLSSLDACSDIERVRAETWRHSHRAKDGKLLVFQPLRAAAQSTLNSGDLPALWAVFCVGAHWRVLVPNVSSGAGVLPPLEGEL